MLQVVSVKCTLDGRHSDRQHILMLGRQELGEGRVVFSLSKKDLMIISKSTKVKRFPSKLPKILKLLII